MNIADMGSLFQNVGVPGAVIVVLFWQVLYLQKKLVGIIENNTRVMIELKDHCGSKNK